MKKYVWFTRYLIMFDGWSNWKINETDIEIVAETENAWKIKYKYFWNYYEEWIPKDYSNKLEEIKNRE